MEWGTGVWQADPTSGPKAGDAFGQTQQTKRGTLQAGECEETIIQGCDREKNKAEREALCDPKKNSSGSCQDRNRAKKERSKTGELIPSLQWCQRGLW